MARSGVPQVSPSITGMLILRARRVCGVRGEDHAVVQKHPDQRHIREITRCGEAIGSRAIGCIRRP